MSRRALCFLAFLVILVVAGPAAGQPAHVPPGAILYIESPDFGKALSAAILKKEVRVRITTDREKAFHFLESASEDNTKTTGECVAKVLVLGMWAGSGKSFDASVTIADTAGSVLFGYNSKKSNFQSAAESVAKNLTNHNESVRTDEYYSHLI